ncbi:hypothetical protein OIE66_35390 [Nonomuraea sp. NBC_01738]|uniref:phosphorylase family protein n=1 Tax=Nonomuraea sp. NBC_01738 TaxID=2976003 RepID=UPI002E0D1E7D|nr:hypothetical protein OIE66_35390 [Nonomuraea sp. NBC_01738]
MIGIITALPVEAAAVRHVLDRPQERSAPGDPNRYVRSLIAGRPVVATTLATSGNTPAADACAHLVRSFPEIRAVIMCGIALGVPRPGDPERDVRLGDVVVGTGGVVHYGHRRVTDDGTSLRGETLVPSPILLRAVSEIRIAQARGESPWAPWLENTPAPAYERPEAGAASVFYGRIGSADELLRSAVRRDEIAVPAGLLAMEMEGAGAAVSAALGGRECLVVRGVSDYGDARKSDLWQPYASMTAAAYVRALLEALGPADGQARAKPVLMELVELMERVPSLQTPGDREEVLRLMGPPVASRVSQDRRARMALISLARICLDQPAGFETLIGALVELEGESSRPVRDLAAAVERLPDGQ